MPWPVACEATSFERCGSGIRGDSTYRGVLVRPRSSVFPATAVGVGTRRPSLARHCSSRPCLRRPSQPCPADALSRPCPAPAPAEPRRQAELHHPADPRRPTEPRRPTQPHCPACAAPAATAASAATAATAAPAATAAMASLTVLTFDAERRAVDFDVWVDDLQLFLQCDSWDGVSLFDHTSGVSTAPAATADSTVRSQWTTRDAVARLAVHSHLSSAERAHFGQYKTAQSLYDAVVARYSSPATAALSRLMLPYLFPDLATFATIADLITHLRTSDARYRAALLTEDHFLSLCPTELTVELLEECLTAVKDYNNSPGPPPAPPTAPSAVTSVSAALVEQLVARINALESHQAMSIDGSSYARGVAGLRLLGEDRRVNSERSFTFDNHQASAHAQDSQLRTQSETIATMQTNFVLTSKLKTPVPFDGKDFYTWSFEFELLAATAQIWMNYDGSLPVSTEGTIQEKNQYYHESLLAYTTLLQNLSPSEQLGIRSYKSEWAPAYASWEHLRNSYMATYPVTMSRQLSQLTSVKMQQGRKAGPYINWCRNLRYHIKKCGGTIPDDMFVSMVHSGLGPNWRQCQSLLCARATISESALCAMLLSEQKEINLYNEKNNKQEKLVFFTGATEGE
ncbi:unnamed protein product [Closterium sp. NIES-54]